MKKWWKAIKRKRRVVNVKKYEHDLHLRLDQKTDELLQRNLDRTNEQRKKKINQSEYVRQLICRDNLEQLGIDKSDLMKCVRSLAGLGNNVNQIAHNMNSGIYTIEDLENLRSCMADIGQMRMDISKLLKYIF